MEKEELGLISFRLNKVEEALEKHITEINQKLDTLLEMQGDYKTNIALIQKSQNDLELAHRRITNRLSNLEEKSTSLQVSLAEKAAPGAIAGGIISAILIGIKALFGV